MKQSIAFAVLALTTVVGAISCTNKQKTQYIGQWILSDISLDGKHWDKSLMPDEEMTITISPEGTALQCMGEKKEEVRWNIDDNGNIVMGEQMASIDDEGYLVADHNGTIVRLAKK